MRADASWMTAADDRILEFYDETAIAAPPAVVSFNLNISTTHAKRRISELREYGLIERVDDDRGYYQITDLGQRYLDGSATKEDIEES